MSDIDKVKNASLRYPSRPASIDARSMDTNFYPFDAFEFDDPNTVSEPRVSLKDPWVFDVGTIIASEIQGGVIVEGSVTLDLTDENVVETVYNGSKVYWTKVGGGVYSQALERNGVATLVSTNDFSKLFVTPEGKVGGILTSGTQGVWVEDLQVVTDVVYDVAFKDYANIFCVADGRRVYKYNYLTSTSSLCVDETVFWIGLDDQGNLIYQTSGGIFLYNEISASRITTGIHFDMQRAANSWVIRDLDNTIYYYDEFLIDSGLVASDISVYEDALLTVDLSQKLTAKIDNKLLEGLKLQGDELSANFIANSTSGSATLVTTDLDQMKKIFVGDLITGKGLVQAEVIRKGGNFVIVDGTADETSTNFAFDLSGTRLTLNANQIIIPGTITANEIEAGTITADLLTITPGEIGAVSEDDLDTLTDSLGDLAYKDLIANGDITDATIDVAKLGTTVIQGGYLNTGLIEADAITADMLAVDSVYAGAIQTGSVGTNKLASNLTPNISIKSSNWNGSSSANGTAGWAIYDNGNLFAANGNFRGDLEAAGGTFGGLKCNILYLGNKLFTSSDTYADLKTWAISLGCVSGELYGAEGFGVSNFSYDASYFYINGVQFALAATSSVYVFNLVVEQLRIATDIEPLYDSQVDLGSSTRRFRRIFNDDLYVTTIKNSTAVEYDLSVGLDLTVGGNIKPTTTPSASNRSIPSSSSYSLPRGIYQFTGATPSNIVLRINGVDGSPVANMGAIFSDGSGDVQLRNNSSTATAYWISF